MNKKTIIALIIVAVLSTFGCAASQKPVVAAPPANPCAPCWEQTKATTVEYAGKAKTALTTGAIISIEVADTTLEYLQKAEKYLQEKIEQFKANHPEMVEAAEEQLRDLRGKIEQYKVELSQKLEAK